MSLTKTVVIGRRVKRVSLQRYLWSKIVYEPEKVTIRHLYALFINQIWLENKASSDVEFRTKFEKTLEVSSMILKELNLSRGFDFSNLNNLAGKVRSRLESFLVPHRNFGQWKSRFDSTVVLSFQQQLGTDLRKVPPKKYIGKGYGDKGTAKKPELDGSPSWQEVASSDRLRLQRRQSTIERINNAQSIYEIIHIIERLEKE